MVEIALIVWLPITAALFVVLRPHIAAAASMIFGVALLPSLRAIPMPVLPDLDQYTIPVFGCLLMTLLRVPHKLMAANPGRGPEALILLMIGGALITNLTNMDPQVFGANVLPGMSVTDTINDALRMIFRWAVPFFLGRALVQTAKQASEVLVVLALAGLFYVPFILVELQTGPYFHALIYGAAPSPNTFWDSLKYGGFRPVVLMNHGLTTSAFMLYATLAWVALVRLRIAPFRLPPRGVVALMLPVVAFCKSRAVWMYGTMAIPALFFLRPRLQLLATSVIAAVILTYPFLRSVDLIPIQAMGELAEEYAGYDAAQSFLQRFETEDQILGRTSERYFFGWGGYSRHFVYDPVTGQPLSTMDGFWLIEFGRGGIFRFLVLFSFLLYPIFYATRRVRRIPSRPAQGLICAMAWIVTLRTFDLMPNATIDPYLTFLGGAICGVVQYESGRPRQQPQTQNRSQGPKTEEPPAPTSLGALASGPPDAARARRSRRVG